MPDSAKHIEERMKQEQDAARRWLKKHKHELPPEDLWEPRVRTSEQVRQREVSMPSASEFGASWEDWVVSYQEYRRWVPLQGEDKVLDLASITLGKRVEHVLSFMPDEQRELLLAYYIEGAHWQELRNERESRQAVHQRLAWARNSFEKEWLAHAEDAVELSWEDF